MTRYVEEALVEECRLTDWDPAGDDIVWVKQALTKDETRRERAYNKYTITMQGSDTTQTFEFPFAELRMVECYLAFHDSNLKRTSGALIFKQDMSESEFRAAFGTLPVALAREWHKHVRRVNPHWDTAGNEEVSKN